MLRLRVVRAIREDFATRGVASLPRKFYPISYYELVFLHSDGSLKGTRLAGSKFPTTNAGKLKSR